MARSATYPHGDGLCLAFRRDAVSPYLAKVNLVVKAEHFPLGIVGAIRDISKMVVATKNRSVLIGLCLLTISLFVSSCVTEPSALTGQKRSYGYTWQQELELGRSSDRELIQEMGLYQDDELSAYVTEIGERVLAQSDLRQPDTPEIYRNLEFTFRVMDSSVVNAFALPGGYVYVTRGLLAHLNNEAQLAVVLGHEITHVAARHASQQALKQQWGQIGLVAGAVIGTGITGNENFADQFLGLGGSVFQMLTLKYGRDAERESDLYGVEYSAKAGYAVGESAEFFNSLGRISSKSGSRLPTWQSSHPDPGEREGRIKQLVIEMRARYGDLKVGEAEYLSRIDGLVVGENPRAGVALRGKFYHPDMNFQFDVPQDWRVKNEASRVTLTDSAGRAIVIFGIGQGDTPEAAARSFVAGANFQPARAGSAKVGSQPGYSVEGLIETSSGTMAVENLFFSYNKMVFSFLSYALHSDREVYWPSFSRIAQSFKPIENPAIRGLEPARLKVQAASREMPFKNYISGDEAYGLAPIDLAIINQVELDQRVQKGRMLKLVSN